MKPGKQFAACLVLMLATTLGLWGCASSKRHDTESTLSAAGFHSLAPTTPQQQSLCTSLPPYTLQRHDVQGKMVYAYSDPKQGVCYVGGEPQYQRYQQLAIQQKIAKQQLQAAQMNENAAANWGYWGPPGYGWW